MSHIHLAVDFPETHVAVVSLNRPQAAGALNTQMALELKAVFADMAGQRSVILTGTGKHFCAGADLKERKDMDEKAWKTQHLAFREARDAVLHCPVPVIAAVNGTAYGGGLELALACDFIYAADHARFALPEATLGIMPGMGGTQTLPRAAGTRRAKELIFTGRSLTADEARQWGIVNAVFPADRLMGETLACARAIAAGAPLALKSIKTAINQSVGVDLATGFALELSEYDRLLATRDRKEGINAFNDKRKPDFHGE